MEYKVGMEIEIIKMDGEPQYSGKKGIIKKVSEDPWGDLRLDGTWGGLAVYPDKDEIKIIG